MLMYHFGAKTHGSQGHIDQNEHGKAKILEK